MLGMKALAGGLFVVVFALISEVLKPKRFAGLFSAAPSVALASLAITVAVEGHAEASVSAKGMLVGAVAFTASAAVGGVVARRRGVRTAIIAVGGAWFALALPLYGLFLA
jgi:hypothetical protein